MYQRPQRATEIYHHGVKGQKWGLRRYQNPDGSLTSLGKKHYQIAEAIASDNTKRANTLMDSSRYEYDRRKGLIGPSRAIDLSEAGHAFLNVRRNEMMAQEFQKAISDNRLKLGEDFVIQKVIKDKPVKGIMSDEEFRRRTMKFTNTIGQDSTGKKEMILTEQGRKKYNEINSTLQKKFEKENSDLIKEVRGFDKASKKELNKLLKGINDPELRELVEMEYYDGYYN